MGKEAPPSPIKANTSAFLNRLRRVKSGPFGPSEIAGEGDSQDAGRRTDISQADGDTLVETSRRATEVDSPSSGAAASAPDRPVFNAKGLSAVNISTSPFLPSSGAFGDAPATPPSAPPGALRVDTASIDPACISLPLPSPTEDEALSLTDVIELQAFVEKKRWIQQQIDVLRSLESIDCFAGCLSTFEPVEAESSLPTAEAVEAMFKQHEQVEAEVEKLDGGEIARLRQMAKAASAKSLSRADTDLLEITLSTLFLLDTLLHLLRDRGDTLDLLALRFDWDSRRANIALEVSAITRDVELFVEQRGRWSAVTYRQPPAGSPGHDESHADGVSRTRATRRGSDASIKSMSSARSFGPGNGTASRSQRFLMTQIMEFDCQSFQNRISSLRNGPVAQAGRVLDRMIDVAATIRARDQVRVAHERSVEEVAGEPPAAAAAAPEAVPATDKAEGGALPDWFLDEMDAVELKVDQLRAWDDLARAHARQWKVADQLFHTLRKSQVEAEALVSDIAQASLQHPSDERARNFDAKIAQILSAATLAGETLSDKTALAIPSGLFAATSPGLSGQLNAIVDFLAAELTATRRATRLAEEKATGYRQLADRVRTLDSLRSQMADLAQELDDALGDLSRSPTAGAPDLSNIACLQPESHQLFANRLADLSLAVPAAIEHSKPLLQQAAVLLMAVKASGMDPNLRSAVVGSSSRLQDLALAAETALASAQRLVSSLDAYRSISTGQDDVFVSLSGLRVSLLAALHRQRWHEPPLPFSADAGVDSYWDEQLAALARELASRVSEPMASLDDVARRTHIAITDHLDGRTTHLCSAVAALTELGSRLLPSVDDQRRSVERFSAQGTQLRQTWAAKAASTTLDAIPPEVARLESETEAFLTALPRDVPLVSSPALADALAVVYLLPTGQAAPLTPSDATAPDVLWTSSDDTSPATAIDLTRLDASVRAHLNTLAAELVSGRELLRDTVRRSQVSSFDKAVEAVDAELSAVLNLVDAVRDKPHVASLSSATRRDNLDEGLQRLTTAFNSLVEAAALLPDQARAQVEVSRLQRAADEMAEMASTALHPSRACSRSTSVASSLASETGSSEADIDGGQISFLCETTASNGRPARPASASRPSSSPSTLSPTAAVGSIAPDVKTPTKIFGLASSGRPRLPTSTNPARTQSPRLVSGPSRSPLPGSQPSRLPAGPPRGQTRPRAVSSAGPDGHVATPSRLRLSSQPADFLSPTALRSPPAGSSSSALPRALRYALPGAQAPTPERRFRPRVSGDAHRAPERVVRAAATGDVSLATPTRRRSSSRTRPLSTSLSRRPYVPQKGHKLDRAVSKIVNAMPMEIPIVAAHEGSDAEAGRYWIGEPPRLCYCRILRSRTVMVRVGGGWVELSKFLRDHFKDMIPTSSPSTVLSPADPGKGERGLSGGGGGPSTPSRTPGSRVVSQPLSQTLFLIADSPSGPPIGDDLPPPATPDREDHSIRRTRKVSGAPATPTFATPRTMTVLVSSPGPESPSLAAGPGSPASPLVPLQLMRKAGDGERSKPSSLGAAAGLGLGLPSTSQASRPTPRTTSGASATGSRSRPSIPWRF